MYDAFDPADRAQGIPPGGEKRIREWLDAILGDDCLNVIAWCGDDDRRPCDAGARRRGLRAGDLRPSGVPARRYRHTLIRGLLGYGQGRGHSEGVAHRRALEPCGRLAVQEDRFRDLQRRELRTGDGAPAEPGRGRRRKRRWRRRRGRGRPVASVEIACSATEGGLGRSGEPCSVGRDLQAFTCGGRALRYESSNPSAGGAGRRKERNAEREARRRVRRRARHHGRRAPREQGHGDRVRDAPIVHGGGELVPDPVVNEIVKAALADADGFVLDGYPRNLDQAEYLSGSRISTP